MDEKLIPVIHDAVKIGLGALIGGGFTLVGIVVASRRKLRESLVSDRRTELRKIAIKLERVQGLFLRNVATIEAALPFDAQKTKVAKLLREMVEEYLGELSPQIEEALYTLHETEAELCLLGYEHISALAETYRFTLGSIVFLEEISDAAEKSKYCEEYKPRVMEARLALLRSLAAEYKNT